MKKNIINSILVFLTVLTISLIPHIHDGECGYDAVTGKGCIYEVALYKDGYLGN